jgi:CubicO group peptidase (beta-lactamase class C family)
MPLTQNTINNVKKEMAETNSKSGALFQGCVYGNAFSEEEEFIGVGEGRVGEEVNDDMYWRWASMTKIIGLLFLGIGLEENLISLDDRVSKYIPEFSQIDKYISDAIAVPDTFDKYGTPVYNMVTTTEKGLGDKITIRHLLNMKSGLGYGFWGTGSTRASLLNPFAATKSGQKMISFIQYYDKLFELGNTSIDSITSYYYKNPLTETDVILERIKQPLLCYPGSEKIYGVDTGILGAVIGRALQMKGFNCTASQYCQWKIFLPLKMDTSWICGKGLNPPSDVLEKLTDAYFVRQSNIDGQGGINVELNKTYRCFEEDAQGDGFAFQELNRYVVSQNFPSLTDYLSGGFQGGGAGKLSDLCKIFKIFINKGKYKTVDENNNIVLKQLVKEDTINFLLSSKDLEPELWGFGKGTFNLDNPYETWTGGMAKTNDLQSPNIPFSFGNNVYRWGGYFGNTFIFNTDSGNYMVSGTQVSAASWQLKTLPNGNPPTRGFQVDAIKLYQILTSNFDGNY